MQSAMCLAPMSFRVWYDAVRRPTNGPQGRRQATTWCVERLRLSTFWLVCCTKAMVIYDFE